MFDYDETTYNAAVAALEEAFGTYTGIYMGDGSGYNTAAYNNWTGYLTNQDSTLSAVAGNQIYQGLAASTLDEQGNIAFNYLDAGLFTTSTVSGKSVYTNVGLPFEYDSTTRQYSFNAKEMGAWFDGEASSDVNLVYSATPQGISNSTNQDDSPTGWFPFNDSSSTTETTETVTTSDWIAGGDISSEKNVLEYAAVWTITKSGSEYNIYTTSTTILGNTKYYITVGNNSGNLSTTSTTLTIKETSYGDNSVSIGNSGGSYWLNQNGGASGTTYKGYGTDGSSDDGSRFYFYQQNEDGSWFVVDVDALVSDDSFIIVSYRGQVLTGDTSSITGTSIVGTVETGSYTFKPVSNIDYYFGMEASIDFTMTEDGKITYKDENGDEVTEDIVFHFSGDDDVWVFIDGTLVLDIGGIHNRIDGDINFATGEWTITQNYKSTDLAVDYVTGTTAGSSGNLWGTDGTLGTTLATFAAQETHTLTVFYMERGAGASNCEITFNLPMKDYVTVTKEADMDSAGTTLTDDEQEVVDNMEFTFTIYKENEKYANQTYTVLNATTGNAIRTASTDADGQFTLHPGETARFTTMFAEEGESWYVVESDPGSAFDTDYKDAGWTTSTSTVYDVVETSSSDVLVSNTLTVYGNAEASSTINFVCNNVLDATLPNPSAVPSDDRIVIDYGLAVEIDVKSNDYYRAEEYEIVAINATGLEYDNEGNLISYIDSTYSESESIRTYTGEFGTVTLTDAQNGKLTYQLTSQLTDVESITYIVKVTSSLTNEDTGL
ncbi:MAG: fibro-slime domain-containing protein [Lachnospiraceae bacterium]|nr:fibro-slime domain-containing protein [Lachnospiraceae bacterium]